MLWYVLVSTEWAKSRYTVIIFYILYTYFWPILYKKSVLRYKFLIFGVYHLDILYLREQGCEDSWLLFEVTWARMRGSVATFRNRVKRMWRFVATFRSHVSKNVRIRGYFSKPREQECEDPWLLFETTWKECEDSWLLFETTWTRKWWSVVTFRSHVNKNVKIRGYFSKSREQECEDPLLLFEVTWTRMWGFVAIFEATWTRMWGSMATFQIPKASASKIVWGTLLHIVFQCPYINGI